MLSRGLRTVVPRGAVQRTAMRSMSSEPTLRERIVQIIPQKQHEIKELTRDHGDKVMGTCTVAQAIGGMRSVKSMIWETSLLDSMEGIRFRGHTIPDLQKILPVAKGGVVGQNEPLPEGLLWLLLTGEVPTESQVTNFVCCFCVRVM